MIKKGLYVLSIATMLSADTTMCFKKDWSDLGAIETTFLDGGKCAGAKSVVDMKEDGWIVDDIKISSAKNGMDFIYVLKKDSGVVLTNNQLEDRLEKMQEKKIEEEKKENIQLAKENGKKIYTSKCISCHGDGSIRAYNTARPLRDLSVDEIKTSIRAYTHDEKDNGMAILMKPYADLLGSTDVENVADYIQTLK